MKDLNRFQYENTIIDSSKQLCCPPTGKKVEIYMFVDPICSECWALEPILKKLQIEYGKYFSLKYILSGRLASLNLSCESKMADIANLWEKTASRTGISCDNNLWFKDPVSSPFTASVAIKAAELQGRNAGIRFLRKLQEVLFLKNKNVSSLDVLVQCAKDVNLDVDEFISDVHSDYASRAFQCDLKITQEMEVTEIPTLVLFNENIEEEGLKISGYYHYSVYEQILLDMLGDLEIEKEEPPSIIDFVKQFELISMADLRTVYDLTEREVETEMKKLILQQLVVKLPIKYGSIWKYIGD